MLARPGAPGEIVRELREATSLRLPFCWWDELRDETRGVIDREALRGRGDFAADLLALADATQLDPAARAELAAGLVSEAPRAFSAVLDGIVGDDERFARLVEEATTVALDSVAGDEP